MTLNPKIYKIDKEHRDFKKLSGTESIIERVLRTSFNRLGIKSSFDIKELNKSIIDEVSYYLYLFNTEEFVSDWESFLPASLTKNQNFFQKKLSLILFIEYKHNIFLIIGGNAYQIIVPFIDHSFGLNTYSRIMNRQEDELILIKSRGISGSRAGISEQFRDNFRIINFMRFGKIPQDIYIKLSQEISDLHFGFFKNKTNDRVQVRCSKGFQIKKEFDFENLHKLIIELGYIEELVPSDYLTSYREITDKAEIDTFLYPELIEKIFNDTEFVNKPNDETIRRFEHDFCNPNNIEAFYEADEYHLKEKTEKNGHVLFKIIHDRNKIYDSVLRRAVEKIGVNDRFEFMVYLQGVRITCYKQKKKTISSGFLFHISTEFQINGKPYFLVDTKWYSLKDSFVEDLRTSAYHILNTYIPPKNVLPVNWNKDLIKTEKAYNFQYNNHSNYIVIDTIITDGIELCDILHYDENNIYLIHVKYGFNSKLRELSNQITISARRLKETLATKEKSLIDEVYNQLIERNHDIDNLTSEDFKKLFSKRISYVLAFTSHLSQDLKISDNIDKFNSNIARYSLIQCSSDMRANYYDMYATQILRE